MTIKLNMTPVISIDLRPVVVAFLKDKDRHPQIILSRKKQEYCHGFLKKANLIKPHFNFLALIVTQSIVI